MFLKAVKRFFVDLYVDLLLVLLLFIRNYSGIKIGLLEYVGLLIGLASFILWIVSRIQLGKNFSALPTAKGLVTHGLYSKIRNPMYVFSSLSILGAVLPSRSPFQYFLLTLLVIVQIIRSVKEETVLKRKFGKKYIEYKSHTWF